MGKIMKVTVSISTMFKMQSWLNPKINSCSFCNIRVERWQIFGTREMTYVHVDIPTVTTLT